MKYLSCTCYKNVLLVQLYLLLYISSFSSSSFFLCQPQLLLSLLTQFKLLDLRQQRERERENGQDVWKGLSLSVSGLCWNNGQRYNGFGTGTNCLKNINHFEISSKAGFEISRNIESILFYQICRSTLPNKIWCACKQVYDYNPCLGAF